MKEKSKNLILIYLGMLVVAIYLMAPIIWIVMMSFKNKLDVVSMPPKIFFNPTLDNYKALFGLGAGGLVTGSTFLSSF